MTTYVMKVNSRWAQKIFSGEKTIEGRLNDANKWGKVRKGDILVIQDHVSLVEFSFIVSDIRTYPTVEDYLINEGLRNCLPGVIKLDEGVGIYRSFWPDEDIRKYGIIAFQLQVIERL